MWEDGWHDPMELCGRSFLRLDIWVYAGQHLIKYPWFCLIPGHSLMLTSMNNELFYKLFSVCLSQMPLSRKSPPRTSLVLTDTTDLFESVLLLLSRLGSGSHPLASVEGSPQPRFSWPHCRLKGSKPSVSSVVLESRKSQDWQQNPLSMPYHILLNHAGTPLTGLWLLCIMVSSSSPQQEGGPELFALYSPPI